MKKLVPDPPAISLPAPPSPQDCNTLIHVLTLTLQQTANDRVAGSAARILSEMAKALVDDLERGMIKTVNKL